jgi:ankyrin repeat protein
MMLTKPKTALVTHKRTNVARLLVEAKTCKPASVKRYIEAGGDVEACVELAAEADLFSFYRVPLLHAAVLRHAQRKESVELLLAAGANINSHGYQPDGNDRSVLMLAARLNCCDEIYKLLLEQGADPYWQSRADALSPLRAAAGFARTEQCKMLLKATEGRALTIAGMAGVIPVWMAAAAGHLDIVKLLHQHGADLTIVNEVGETMLHAAAGSIAGEADLPVLEYLLSKGLDVNATQQYNVPPLIVAVFRRSVAAVQLLLEHGADPSIADSTYGCTALHHAAQDSVNQLPLLQCLLSSGRVGDVNAVTTTCNATALYCSVETGGGCVEAVQLLLEHGADPTIAVVEEVAEGEHNSSRHTSDCLALAVGLGHTAIVELLLDHGMDISATYDAVNHCSVTLLFYAAEYGHLDLMRLLVARGIDIDAVDFEGRSALTAAAAESDTVAPLQLLLELGADPNKEVLRTPLYAAAVRGDVQFAQALLTVEQM